jgi:hypothetical protein
VASSSRHWMSGPLAEGGPSKIPVGANTANAHRDDMKCSGKSHQQQFTRPTCQLADEKSPHRPTEQEPDGRREALTRHVRWTSRSHARRYVAEEGHHTSRKMLNLRPMRDGGIMSASKFTSRIHLNLAGRDEPALRDSSKYCAFCGTIWSHSSEPSLEISVVSSSFNW